MSDDDKQPETAAEPAEDATAMPEAAAAAEQQSMPPSAWEPPPPEPMPEAGVSPSLPMGSDIPPLDHTGDSLPSHDPHWSAIKKWMRRELALLMGGVHNEDDRREMNP